MAFCSIMPDSRKRDRELSDDKDIPQTLDLDSQYQDGLLLASSITATSASASASCLSQDDRARFGLSTRYTATPMPSMFPREPRWYGTRSAVEPAAHALNPSCDLQAMLQAEVGSESGPVDGGINCEGGVAEPTDTREMVSDFRKWVGLADDAGNEDGLAEEDWLEATHALLASAEGHSESPAEM